jgi:chemotaxis response regulator CheB
MKKILLINEEGKKSFFFRIISSMFTSIYDQSISPKETESIIEELKPEFIMLDVIRPVNGMDMMDVLRHIDGNIRLRVVIYKLGFTLKRKAMPEYTARNT